MKSPAILLADLGYGDGGKGTMVDYLARCHSADLVVRYNGGPQAAHNVVLSDGRRHTFSQFGSATFLPGVRTLLSRFMLIEPYALLNEDAHLQSLGVADALHRLTIDGNCLVITPLQQIANRMIERSRGSAAHGSCGMGVGQCMTDSLSRQNLAIRAVELAQRDEVRRKLHRALEQDREKLKPLRDFATADEHRVLDDEAWIDEAVDVYAQVAQCVSIVSAKESSQIIESAACPMFEGAQGVLLDERYGVMPFVTWGHCTFDNAHHLLAEAGDPRPTFCLGVLRTYMTRHGAGPFISFDANVIPLLPEPHNSDGRFQGPFLRGPLSIELLKQAISACGRVDGLAITHLDRLSALPPVTCEGDSLDTTSDSHFISGIEQLLGVRVRYTSHGPSELDKRHH